jgi:hypothetical protein
VISTQKKNISTGTHLRDIDFISVECKMLSEAEDIIDSWSNIPDSILMAKFHIPFIF